VQTLQAVQENPGAELPVTTTEVNSAPEEIKIDELRQTVIHAIDPAPASTNDLPSVPTGVFSSDESADNDSNPETSNSLNLLKIIALVLALILIGLGITVTVLVFI
jgi:hypothetical protein